MIRLDFSPPPPVSELGETWRALEARADGSFFLSWTWIGTLIAQFGPPALVATARRDGRVVGLALFGRRQGPRWDLLRSPSLHLNETGDDGQDAVMIEYNGVLAERGHEDAVTAALLRALAGPGAPSWRELHLSAVGPGMEALCRAEGLRTRLLRHHHAPFAELGADDPLEQLSRNARQQIRRSLRLYEERGPLALERAATEGEALDWLDQLERLHTAAWQARGLPGAFANAHFRPFHRRLVAAGLPLGAIDLLRLRAGEEVVGLLYNFRHGGRAYSYQSGFRYETDERLKPGLASHVMALRLYQREGLAAYRFLAGDSRYKNTLATGRDELLWLAAHRPDAAHCLEALARRVLTRLRRTAADRP
jgi:CelD/BcsL family acetyltransferase involved in cellulose biosynthesis